MHTHTVGGKLQATEPNVQVMYSEGIITMQARKRLVKNCGTSATQRGFIVGNSCPTNLSLLLNDMVERLEQAHRVKVCYTIFGKVF